MTTIKRCPFCYGTSYLTQSYSYKTRNYFVYVKCDLCGAHGKSYKADEEPAANEWNTDACNSAVNAWNTRVE